ncbi:CHASE2 domain-containing protein [Eleftheria terrae]|uniref:CHASE2 domain-containing protein n=1 Tax=Eleftheria terrae TaxID=1597781 RepID=UPI00263AD5AF|nr:adenylate/guanylate cyclase domain-containing protein [Eleftheria terrae]WKB53074.1 adenylate/guanylate cyclase domain-containing protein [Eleftheria terrae]
MRQSVLVAGFASIGAALALSPLQSLEPGLGLAALYAMRGAREAPPRVTVVALNTEAAEALGTAPRPDRWPRRWHAELIEGLHRHGAAVVAFDLLFDRPRDEADDQRLSTAMREAGNVVLVEYLRRDVVRAGATQAVIDRSMPALPLFTNATLATAPFVLPKTPQGVSNYLAFAPEQDDRPTLPLVLAAALDPMPLTALSATLGVPAEAGDPARWLAQLRRAARSRPPQEGRPAAAQRPAASRAVAAWQRVLSEVDTRVWLNLYGPPGHIDTVPYDRALTWLRTSSPEAARFRGRAVLVGLSEFKQTEQRDGYPTAWSTDDGLDVSGVELAATAVANWMDGSALRPLPPAARAALVAAFAAAVFGAWLLSSPARAALLSLAVAGLHAAAACMLFARAGLWLPMALPILVVLPAAALSGLLLRFAEVERQRRRLHAALDRYGPREAVARLARELDARSEDVYVVCMSSDIEDYTRRVEAREPVDARLWVNAYFQKVFPIVREHGGHVVDHAGDSTVCIWLSGGSPAAACQAAVDAARALHRALNPNAVGAPFDADAWPTRIGLHFGPVALGEVGDPEHAEPRVVGDIVNTASRIQSANKLLGTRVLVSDVVAAHLPGPDVRPLGRFLLVGKQRPVGLGDPMPPTPRVSSLYAQALAARAAGQLELARASLRALLECCPEDGPARFLMDRLDSEEPIVLNAK